MLWYQPLVCPWTDRQAERERGRQRDTIPVSISALFSSSVFALASVTHHTSKPMETAKAMADSSLVGAGDAHGGLRQATADHPATLLEEVHQRQGLQGAKDKHHEAPVHRQAKQRISQADSAPSVLALASLSLPLAIWSQPTDKQTNEQTNRQAGRQTDIQTKRERERLFPSLALLLHLSSPCPLTQHRNNKSREAEREQTSLSPVLWYQPLVCP